MISAIYFSFHHIVTVGWLPVAHLLILAMKLQGKQLSKVVDPFGIVFTIFSLLLKYPIVRLLFHYDYIKS